MSDKAIDLRPAVDVKKLMSRDLIWLAIRKYQQFEWLDIEADTGLSESLIKSFLTGLRKGGYLEYSVPPGRYTKTSWKLVRDVGVERPYVNKQGKQSRTSIGRNQMWRALKVISGPFDKRYLKSMASTDEHEVALREAKFYILKLWRAGYLKQLEPGGHHRPATYRVIKSKVIGPRAPMVLSIDEMFDPNIGEVVWKDNYEEKE